MCGIVGYIGDKPCIDVIYSGLKTLEYRGYDSAGIAVYDAKGIHLVKSKGKLKALDNLLPQLPETATIGIGHTRWATHGSPSTVNAHPHYEETFAIVHNGIIENYSELKDELKSEGVKFKTETDTEVILQLLNKIYKQTNDMNKTIQQLVKTIRGAYALGIMNKNEPDQLYIAKLGSPAVLGLGDKQNFFASDAYAIMKHTRKAIYLNDEEYAVVKKDSFEVKTFEGKPCTPVIHTIDGSPSSLDKQGYKHYMLKEINEQPSVIATTLQRLVDFENNSLNEKALGLDQLDLEKCASIHMVACGSAYYTGRVAQYFIENLLDIPVHVELASEFRYREPSLRAGNLFIAVSQSGETLDTLTGVKFAKKYKMQTLSICNVKNSSIPRETDAFCYMDAGPEIGVASTKAFTSQILCLYLFALAAAKKLGKIKDAELKDRLGLIRKLPTMAENALNESTAIETLSAKYYEAKNFIFVGRGTNSAIAYEGALKLKEISYIHAEAYPGGELKHGPIALIDKSIPSLAIIPDDSYTEKMIANVEEIKARDGKVIVVGNSKNEQIVKVATDVIHCPQVDCPAAQSILSTIPLQLFSYYIAMRLGTDIDQPRNLAKSVTVE